MRKRNISLARAYLAFYILFVFTAGVPALLSFKISPVLSILVIVLALACLGGVITSHVFYNLNKNNQYYLSSLISFGAFDLLVIYSFILEVIYTGQGISAPYAWMVNIISIIANILIGIFLYIGIDRLRHPREAINNY
ncbi:MAG: hypothetical protein MJZ37_07315 [Bacilli bacterium]|nr:hypothetical protein [Bacilli bacterium]